MQLAEPQAIMLAAGAVKSQKIYKATSAHGLIEELRAAGADITANSIDGMNDMPSEPRQWVLDALSGHNLTGRDPPLAHGSMAARKEHSIPVAATEDESNVKDEAQEATRRRRKQHQPNERTEQRRSKKRKSKSVAIGKALSDDNDFEIVD